MVDEKATNPVRWEDFNAYRRADLLTLAWRWRTEVTCLSVAAILLLVMGKVFVILLLAFVAVILFCVVTTPAARARVTRRSWCLFTRHRLYTVFREARLTTRTGRLPLVMRVSPTAQGERALIWCRAGISLERLQSCSLEIGEACIAEQAVISPRLGPFARIDLIRRRPHGRSARIPSPRPSPEAVPKFGDLKHRIVRRRDNRIPGQFGDPSANWRADDT
jgi:hypothetical protein